MAIHAVLGHGDPEGIAADRLAAELEWLQDAYNLLDAETDAQVALHFLGRQVNDYRLRLEGIDIDHTLGDCTASQAAHQFAGPPHGRRRQLRMDALAKAQAGLAGQLEGLRRAPNADKVKVG